MERKKTMGSYATGNRSRNKSSTRYLDEIKQNRAICLEGFVHPGNAGTIRLYISLNRDNWIDINEKDIVWRDEVKDPDIPSMIVVKNSAYLTFSNRVHAESLRSNEWVSGWSIENTNQQLDAEAKKSIRIRDKLKGDVTEVKPLPISKPKPKPVT
ncbi:MAG: hypothetical protein R3240_09680 [Gammaproteobacteria bacterium]|nr:hypothetical protein [Gammaproteobacteria bacterium]